MGYENIDDNGRIVTLRKRRQCEWCNEWLEKGDKAVTRTYKSDEQFHNSRMHPECFEALNKSLPFLDYGEFNSGDQGRGQLVGEL